MHFDSFPQTVSWLRDRYREGNLTIKPPYQRKPVWVARQKCYLVESMLLGYPVPEIYMQETTSPEGETTYAVVDGQQRVRAVLQFVGSEIDPEEQEYNKFALDKLDNASPWKNLTFAELLDEKKKEFWKYKFTIRLLRTNSDAEVRDMFTRLNKYLTPLKPQELRNATYGGPFVRLTLQFADDEYWAENRIVTAAAIRRMGDVEFVSELLIGVLHGPQGGSAKVIDEYYAQYEDFEDEFPEQRRAERQFKETLQATQAILPNIKLTRWSNKTDFYTLFVGLASLLRSHKLHSGSEDDVHRALTEFEKEINARLADENATVRREAIDYVRAVEKGANDKKRRADRQAALLQVISNYFIPK